MINAVKLLDVVALTVDLPEFNLWRGKWVLLLKSSQMVRRLKLNLAIAQDALTSLLVYVQSKLWCCILSQYLVMLQLNKVRGDR